MASTAVMQLVTVDFVKHCNPVREENLFYMWNMVD